MPQAAFRTAFDELMGKKRKQRRSRRPEPKGAKQPDAGTADRAAVPPDYRRESLPATAATVGWMISAVAALLMEALAVVLRGCAYRTDVAPFTHYCSDLFLFVAMAAGLLSLALMPLALKLRRVQPPKTVALFAALVAASPVVAIALLWAVK